MERSECHILVNMAMNLQYPHNTKYFFAKLRNYWTLKVDSAQWS
jgi:hypothetical protein